MCQSLIELVLHDRMRGLANDNFFAVDAACPRTRRSWRVVFDLIQLTLPHVIYKRQVLTWTMVAAIVRRNLCWQQMLSTGVSQAGKHADLNDRSKPLSSIYRKIGVPGSEVSAEKKSRRGPAVQRALSRRLLTAVSHICQGNESRAGIASKRVMALTCGVC